MSKPGTGRADTDAYRDIFLKDIPLIDMRAPTEFAKGSFPAAVSLPLMQDKERAQVGTTYKEKGQDAAIALGHTLVSGAAKKTRVRAWAAFAAAHPTGYLFCMRGGLRSQISQGWMAEAGAPYPLVKGGYKALRRFLIEERERLVAAKDFVVIAGRTGVGKTLLLHGIPQSVDLEGLANHRGSSFGRRIGDQPTQINFENQLAVALMKVAERFEGPIFLEDESRRIGGVELPLALSGRIEDSPAVLVEESLEERISVIHKDYVVDMLADYRAAEAANETSNEVAEEGKLETISGDAGFDAFADFLLSALYRVRKRLGLERYGEIDALMRAALHQHATQADDSLHRDWIAAMLRRYYDPMYDYQLSRKSRSVVFSGTRAEVLAWQQNRPAAV